MNTETGEIKNMTPEDLEKLETNVEESKKWKTIPIGEEVVINGLHFVIAYARVDTQEVILKPHPLHMGKMKLKL